MKTIIFLALIMLFIFWYKPFDDCRKYSDFNCNQIQNAEYNVWFYFDDKNKGYKLGYAKGLQECGVMAHNYASEKGLSYNDWSYVCCMKAKGSDCYEKHR